MKECNYVKFWDDYHEKNLGSTENIDKIFQTNCDIIGQTFNKSILEIGCGRGDNLVKLSYMFNRVYGCDISQVAVSEAQKHEKYKKITVKKNEFTQIPFTENFDVIFFCKTISTIANQQYLSNLLDNTLSHLRENGFLVVVDFHKDITKLNTYSSIPWHNTNICQLNPVWSEIAYLHFTQKSIENIFYSLIPVRFIKSSIKSCHNNTSNSLIAFFQKGTKQ